MPPPTMSASRCTGRRPARWRCQPRTVRLPPEWDLAGEVLAPQTARAELLRILSRGRLDPGLRRVGRGPSRGSRASPPSTRCRSLASAGRSRPRRRHLREQGLLRRPGDRRAHEDVRPSQPPPRRVPVPRRRRGRPRRGHDLPRSREAAARARPGDERRRLPAPWPDRSRIRLSRCARRGRRCRPPAAWTRVPSSSGCPSREPARPHAPLADPRRADRGAGGIRALPDLREARARIDSAVRVRRVPGRRAP